jgi:hypothetical protein
MTRSRDCSMVCINGDVVHPFRRACLQWFRPEGFLCLIFFHRSRGLKQPDALHPPATADYVPRAPTC